MNSTAMLLVSREDLEEIVEAAVKRAVAANNVAAEREILTREQAAELLQVSLPTVLRHVKNAGLPGFKVGAEWRFNRHELEEWLRVQASKRGGHTGRHAKKLQTAKAAR